MAAPQTILTTVTAVDTLSDEIKAFTLAPVDGELPGFTSGSHVIVQMPDGETTHANAYSLVNLPGQNIFCIAVKREPQSRGGSRYMHEQVQVGSTLAVSPPANLFALATCDGPHILIAGGIGITPFMSHIAALDQAGAAFELHYSYRDASVAAYVDVLRQYQGSGRVVLYDNSQGQKLDLPALMGRLDAHSHVYACGPQVLMDAVVAEAGKVLPAEHVHLEQFGKQAVKDAHTFTVTLARSGKEVEVGPDESILHAIERKAKVKVECLCREGYCGTCETVLLGGQALHLDQYLDDTEKAAQNKIMICVSRAHQGPLVLDL
ncbi:PDR/VanB family oxidoreductase [Leeia oryzae]|uniref:PDR/VanB family oxidoreductase n=1 Tax=Leeia oryzae TaxID=356662 RepID=UPI0003626E19|nr:PDR/VanB family oxidoreductase [Leeia oryzae]